MSQSDINIACNIILNNSPSFDISWPNSQKDQVTDHYQVTFLPAEVENIDISYSGAQDLTGIYQILYLTPINEGKDQVAVAENEILTKFARGVVLDHNSQRAEVVKSYMGSEFQSDQWWVIPFTIEYQGFIDG